MLPSIEELKSLLLKNILILSRASGKLKDFSCQMTVTLRCWIIKVIMYCSNYYI